MGGEYNVLVSPEVNEFINGLDEKSGRIVTDNLEKLVEPYPAEGQGDKKRLERQGEVLYRLHIGRTWTAFYEIDEEERVVRVLDVMGIDDAHKKYGQLD